MVLPCIGNWLNAFQEKPLVSYRTPLDPIRKASNAFRIGYLLNYQDLLHCDIEPIKKAITHT